MSSEEEVNWITSYLLPALKIAGFEHIKILTGEENRQWSLELAEQIFQNEQVRQKIYGISVHWYFDNSVSPTILDEMKKKFPDKQILYTEACNGHPGHG